MRKSVQAEIDEAVASLNRRLDNVLEAVGIVANRISVLNDHVDAIEPARVDLTQEMADDIIRKIHGPLTISKEFSAWIAEQGKFHDAYYAFQIGFGADAGRGEMRLKGDGTMQLTLCDPDGARLWYGTFAPPDFGVKS